MLRIEIEDSMPEGFAEHVRDALSSVRTRRTMARVEHIIQSRTRGGEFLEGSSEGADRYSEKPYAQPAGSLTDQVRDELPEDEVSYFTTSEDALWLVVEGGYKAVRQAKGLPTDRVDLTDQGDLLRGMRSAAHRDVDDGTLQMVVGYIEGASPQEAMQIARYHNVMGAGKNEVKRVFVGLTDSEAEDVLDDVEDDLRKRL